MRIESVEAHAFGPFAGKTLELAPRMTVVYGLNEAGKSSWHAALYALVCGMRRGAGQRKPDKAFAERHQPWEGDRWEVSGVIQLADGRRVRMRHDLAGRVSCSAIDADLGRDYSADIMEDGAPNAAKWLGLDRRSFISTACVRQADILSVAADADALQEHLQRAAATAGADATAAAALSALDAYRREHVGLNRANSTKPLRAALNRRGDARTALTNATEAHREYLRRVEEVEGHGRDAEKAISERQLFEAAWEHTQAKALEHQLARARELAEKYPEEPPREVESNALTESVATALEAWDHRAIAEPLTGPTAEDLQAELDRLPVAPIGDTLPAPEVLTAKESLNAALSVLEAHERQHPPQPPLIVSGGLGRDELRHLAQELSLPNPEIDAGADERLEAARKRLERASVPPRRLRTALVAGIPATAGLFVLVFGPFALAIVLLLAAGVALGVGLRDTGAAARAGALQELREAESVAGTQRFAVAAAADRREAARHEAVERSLPVDAENLRNLADRLEGAQRQAQDEARWLERLAELQQAASDARVRLTAALSERGVAVRGDAVAALERYEDECAKRATMIAEAAGRPQLERALADRTRLEREHGERVAARAAAEDRVLATGRLADVNGDSPDAIAAGLRGWQRDQTESMQVREQARKGWYELQGLLGDGNLADLDAAAQQRASRAEELAKGVDPATI